MYVVVVIVGVILVVTVLADMVNTLVTTTTSHWRYWPTRILYLQTWRITRRLGDMIGDETRRERFYASFAPASVLVMLASWVTLQILGFGLVWWGVGGVGGVDGLADTIYYSGVVYFTVGFGEVVPVDLLPRYGALIEAFCGVLTTAMVIGYLPALYSAYSTREQKLLTLDDGTEERITPTNLVISRTPDADPRELDGFFHEWEAWVAQVMETHTTFPMLSLFRSQNPGQSWITALGLIADAAVHMEVIEGQRGRPAYWTLRRSARLLQMLTEGADLTEYRRELDAAYDERSELFEELYETLGRHGFTMLPRDEARVRSRELRETFDARLEYLIDELRAPRGFWGHTVGHRLEAVADLDPEDRATRRSGGRGPGG